VLLLAAGAERVLASSRVGVHRPRADLALRAPSTTDQARASYGQVVDAMRDYLKVMGMSDRLFAAMMEVPSHRMRMLTHRETVAFGLSSGEAATKATVLYAHDSSSVRSRLSARRPATAGRGKSMGSRKARHARARSVPRRSRFATTRGNVPARVRQFHREGSPRPRRVGRRGRIAAKIKVNVVANFGAGVVQRIDAASILLNR
jgi:hypothetical protein